MTTEQYIEKLKKIRNEITTLIDELWSIPENQEGFISEHNLTKQVVNDILFGYENENEDE